MSTYNPFTKGTTITASDFDDNFEHVGAGTWYPMSGSSLKTTTSGLLDLGSQTDAWDKVYCNNINISGELAGAFNLIAEVTLDETVSSIVFEGMNGDKDETYLLQMRAVCQSTSGSFAIGMTFNGDSATNYRYQVLWAAAAATGAGRGSSDYIELGTSNSATTTGLQMQTAEVLLYSKAGNKRLSLNSIGEELINNYANTTKLLGGLWSNTSSTITTLKINAYSGLFVTNTNIQIWAKVNTITARSITTTP